MGYDNLFPDHIGEEGRFDQFDNGKVLAGKQKNKLPAMGWNSWNAFGSGNTEALTKVMADKIVELGLDKLGYEYVILDDGCYKPERVDGRLSNEEVKFPSGFKALSDYVHDKGLKFGMYNDIGTNLCAGAQVGTCGYEDVDAKSYLEWGVDFLKVDNCYYPFDNATFSNAENARFTFAPNIKAVKVDGFEYKVTSDGKITGDLARLEDDHVTFLGTYDGTGPDASPVGPRSSELIFDIFSDSEKIVSLNVLYATGKKEGIGQWLQVAVEDSFFYDDLLKETETEGSYEWSQEIKISLSRGNNKLRLMNHRRQENTLNSYARLLKELKKLDPDKDIYYSACEWGKTQPHNWGYKVCDSWRILNDITFRVGSDGDPGHGAWIEDYTTSVTTQYNKAVIMDEFSGLDKGWNDPDMLMIGMDGLTETQNKTHMAMWCMMNSPLMLGVDLRRVSKGDEIYNIIANKDLIAINQDKLGVQAKRVYSSLAKDDPSREYIRDIDRVDILKKNLSDGRLAISFINLSLKDNNEEYAVTLHDFNPKGFQKYMVKDVYTKEEVLNDKDVLMVKGLKACDNRTFILTPVD